MASASEGTTDASALTAFLPRPIFQSGLRVEIKYNKSQCYIMGLFQDRSKCMLATFSTSTPDPYTHILNYLEENFNPGPEAKDKLNGVILHLLMDRPTEGEERRKIAHGYLHLMEKIVAFRIVSWGIMARERMGYVDREMLKVNCHPEALLLMGKKGNNLKAGEGY